MRMQGIAVCQVGVVTRVEPDRPWQGLPRFCDDEAKAVFNNLITIEVGRGGSVLFWTDRWIVGMAVGDIALRVLKLVPMQRKTSVQWTKLSWRTSGSRIFLAKLTC